MFLGYNTNGFVHHRLEDAIAILADLGYGGVAITVDHHVLHPFDRTHAERIRGLLEAKRMRCVVETGARFLLDSRRKHQPTLLSAEGRDVRIGFLNECVRLAAVLGADAVSFWSGTPSDEAPDEILWRRLTDGCLAVIDEAARLTVPLAFEPEPGMFIDTMDRYEELLRRLGDTAGVFGLTLDIGHLLCLGETPIADRIVRWKNLLRNVHIEDMRAGVHEHLMFGEGEIDFGPVMRAFREIHYAGGIYVELSRHSHDAVRIAKRSHAFLANAMAEKM